MKRLVAVSCVVLCFVAAGVAFAQAPTGTQPPATAPAGRMTLEQRVDALAKTLGLTDAQKEKVTEIYKKQQEEMAKLRELPQDQRREKMTALRNETNEAISALLTPEQRPKWAEYLKTQSERRPGGRGGRTGGAGAPAAN